MPEVRFSATLTSGGGGAAGSLGLAAAAITTGMAEVVVTVMVLQQAGRRAGGSSTAAGAPIAGNAIYGGGGSSPDDAFSAPSGLASPGQNFSLLAQRHMHRYGTTREHFAEVAISQRNNAIRRPTSITSVPLTLDDYFAARMISDPLCLLDYTLETDGAVAVITTSMERARDLPQPPVSILASANGGAGRWGQALSWHQMPDEYFASSGHRTVARRLYEMAGVGPDAIDVALLYDHFSPMVLMQLEDYGFCAIGESGPFVADGNIRWPTRRAPGEHPRRPPVGGLHRRHDPHPRGRGAAPRHRRQPGRRRRAGARHRRARVAPRERHDPEARGVTDRPHGAPPVLMDDPYADDRTSPFWDAALEGRLVCARCSTCGTFRMPPAAFCHVCRQQDVEWIELPGTGRVYTFTIIRHPLRPEFVDVVPFVVAVVVARRRG